MRISKAQREENDVLAIACHTLTLQQAKGLRKYGTVLGDAVLQPLDLIDHAIQEAADQLMYLVALRKALENDT